MTASFLTFLLLIAAGGVDAAHLPEQQDTVYTVSDVNVKPAPVKGLNDFHQKWSSRVVYPKEAVRQKIQGMVFIEFVVNGDGTITDAAIRSGIGEGCEEAALKVFQELARDPWKPGIKNEKPVRVRMVLPFAFRLIEG